MAIALRYALSFRLRQAVLHMVRPGNQTRVILLAVGLGAFFILGVRALQANLLRDFAVQAGPNAPDMFLVDIQPGQRDQVTAVADGANGANPAPKPIPVLRARVVAVKGTNVVLENYEQVRGRSGLARVHRPTDSWKRTNMWSGRGGIGSPWPRGVDRGRVLERWPIGVATTYLRVLGRPSHWRVRHPSANGGLRSADSCRVQARRIPRLAAYLHRAMRGPSDATRARICRPAWFPSFPRR